MEIRKKFKFEMAHVVRNAWSQRCAHSIHGHSYEVEVFFKGNMPDHGGMVIDFGLIKKYMNDFIDSFDHTTFFWEKESDKKIINVFLRNFDRVILAPFPTSAEVQAEMFLRYAQKMLAYMKENKLFKHGEGNDIQVSRVIVHETRTGYAEAKASDPIFLIKEDKLSEMFFSEKIIEEWKNREDVLKILQI